MLWAVEDSEALLSLYLRFKNDGHLGVYDELLQAFTDLHRPMQTTSLLLFWVMGKIKGLQRGYAVSYCKQVKYSTALACTDGCVPICYALLAFIKDFGVIVGIPKIIIFIISEQHRRARTPSKRYRMAKLISLALIHQAVYLSFGVINGI